MTSPPHSPPPRKVTCNEPENDDPSSPPLSPKRSFALTDEVDHVPTSLGYFKRRHVHNDREPVKRAPLEIDNRPHKDPRWSETSLHSLATAPEPWSCDTNHSIPKNGTEDQSIYSQSPAVQSGDTDSIAGSGRKERPPLTRDARYNSSDALQELVRASAAGSTGGWPSPSKCRSDLTSSERMTSSREWNVDKVTQPITSRAPSMPYVWRPPRDSWKFKSSSDGPVRTVHGLVDHRSAIFDTLVPPGLTRRRGSVPDTTGSRSWSPTSGSQALRADEPSKYERPIGTEQSRVVSMTRRRSRSLPLAKSQPSSSSDAGNSTRRHFSLDSIGTWHGTYLPGDPLTCGVKEAYPPDLPITGDEFYRLLRQAHYNKHTSNIFSPLNPLRNPRPSSSLTANATYQHFFPSIQYTQTTYQNSKEDQSSVSEREGTFVICELRQPLAVASESMHCQGCQRDTLRKRLLASSYRRMRHAASMLRTAPIVHNSSSSPCYRIEEDEKGLWEEVIVATSVELFPGSPRWRDSDDFGDSDDYPEIPDEDLFLDEENVLLGPGELVC
ncbi:uncharacterized protein EDB93DRAFT_1152187 [Suillus bovinus]|uniref:uncharacterized protein n=1 Tax=Suillus bovinus TaxID=48563 RepID=UPI001B86046C|nr:uncharacterized protein EDB93DRAFT_1152187 [Suillus bovinus]KAG2145385.1 hypothetical protein EDB93DRAFT_1152187 [Suillus bovinus]